MPRTHPGTRAGRMSWPQSCREAPIGVRVIENRGRCMHASEREGLYIWLEAGRKQ